MYQFVLLIATAVLIAADQLTKLAAVRGLADGHTVSVWNGVIEFCYSENRGIAWGMFQNRRWIVIAITGVVLAALLVLLMSGRFRQSRLMSLGGVMVLAGGVGNLIDRVMNGYVVDYIHYYKWFDFPIFNLADCCVTIGAVLILIYVFFFGSKETGKKEDVTNGAQAADTDKSTGE